MASVPNVWLKNVSCSEEGMWWGAGAAGGSGG